MAQKSHENSYSSHRDPRVKNIPPAINNPEPISLVNVLSNYPRLWQGLLCLKEDRIAVQMHHISGNPNFDCFPYNKDGTTPPLRILDRMRLDQVHIEGVIRKINTQGEYCVLLALPCGIDRNDVLQNNINMNEKFIQYLQTRQAAGIVRLNGMVTNKPYVLHVFPPRCPFSNELFFGVTPELYQHMEELFYLLIVIVTV